MGKDEKEILRNWSYIVNLSYKSTWQNYHEEYGLAIDNLLERSDQSQTAHLTLPVLFLIRHYLELSFKMNLIDLAKISKKSIKIDYAGKSAHILSNLHKEFEKCVIQIMTSSNFKPEIVKDFKKRNKELIAFRNIFDKLDNWSYAFRYPVTSDGKTPHFTVKNTIFMPHIIPVYKSVQILLNYTIHVLLDPNNKTKHQ